MFVSVLLIGIISICEILYHFNSAIGRHSIIRARRVPKFGSLELVRVFAISGDLLVGTR